MSDLLSDYLYIQASLMLSDDDFIRFPYVVLDSDVLCGAKLGCTRARRFWHWTIHPIFHVLSFHANPIHSCNNCILA